jgi:hypothetical protein
MWNYYVYELRDPDTLEIFYVGKGKDRRVEAHKPDDKTDKGLRLDEIYRKGKKPLRIIIGRFENEDQAFAVEATLIKWVYGKNKLTNIIQGHSHKFIRPREQLIENQLNEMEGVDVPPRDGVNIMRLMEYEKAICKIKEKSTTMACAVEDLAGHFMYISREKAKNIKLSYRATETRLSFFKSEIDDILDLRKKQPAAPVARIFFKSPLNKGGKLHLSFDRDSNEIFSQLSNNNVHIQLGFLGEKIVHNKVDVIISNPSEWRESEDLITNLLINSINR